MNQVDRSRGALTKLADAAFQQASEKVIERAEDTGTPVIVWENEEVTRLEPRKTRKSRRNGRKKRDGIALRFDSGERAG